PVPVESREECRQRGRLLTWTAGSSRFGCSGRGLLDRIRTLTPEYTRQAVLAPIEQIPLVLEDEIPFVVRAEPDPRPHLGVEGFRLRRGPDRVVIEGEAEGAWVKMTLL